MEPHRYVDFVSDGHFLDCVSWVCESYTDPRNRDEQSLSRNGIDPFKMVFDMVCYDMDLDGWKSKEYARQEDKTTNNRTGDFHQRLLGGVDGWVDLGVGDKTKLDLKKGDDTVFIELKNKFNTVNDDSLSKVREKLETNLRRYPESMNYWAYIIMKGGTSGTSAWRYKGRETPRIRRVWGSDVYSLITGRDDSLHQVWAALPRAINDVCSTDRRLDSGALEPWFGKAFLQ